MDPGLALEVSALSRMRAIAGAEAYGDSAVQLAYKATTVFVTGASGFIGKHFVEKLLRSTDVSKVYLLLRGKRGRSPKQRLADILADPLFDSLRKSKPGFSDKLVAVEGDITALALGLSPKDREMLTKEVNFIFHGAATTRFDESLPSATLTNVRGTREVLDLGESCPKLRALVHISTAFSHATLSRCNKDVLEQFYETPVTPDELIKMTEDMDGPALEKATKLMNQDWPNTYCFTKAVAEELVRTRHSLPACVVRPAIVISAYREPAPGWVDTSAAFGPAGVMLGVGLGIIHTMLADPSVRIDVVPADLVNNAVLAAGWSTSIRAAKPPVIYTVSNNNNPTTWGACGDTHRQESRKISTPKSVWYCYCYDTNNRLLFYLLFWLLHYIPAYLIDGVCFLIGKPRRFVKLYTKAYKLFTLNSYFTTHEWRFSSRNLQALQKGMGDRDRQIYGFDVSCIQWNELMLIWCMGLRKYIIKDGLVDTDYAVKKQFWFRIANAIVLALYAYFWWKLFSLVYSAVLCIF